MRKLYIILLFTPLILLMLPLYGPVWSLLNGSMIMYWIRLKPFTEKFNIIHAGICMDQPTIGKWLIWFTVYCLGSIIYIVAVNWIMWYWRIDKDKLYKWIIGSIGVWIIAILVLPLTMLVQYICSMGLTANRIAGLLYCVVIGGLYAVFIVYQALKSNDKFA